MPAAFLLWSIVCPTFNLIWSYVVTKYHFDQNLKTLELDFTKKSSGFPKFLTVSEEFLMKKTFLLKLAIQIGSFEISQVNPTVPYVIILNLESNELKSLAIAHNRAW